MLTPEIDTLTIQNPGQYTVIGLYRIFLSINSADKWWLLNTLFFTRTATA